MRITRRQFIKYVSAAGAALGLSELQVFKLTEAVAKLTTGPKVLWLQGQPCNGCSIATVQLFHDVTPQDVDSLTGADIGFGVAGAIIDTYGQAVEDHLDGTGAPLGWSNNGSGPTADIADVLLDVIDLEFHQTLMSAAGYLAIDNLMASAAPASSGFILAVEGSIPEDGTDVVGEDACHIGVKSAGPNTPVTMRDAVAALAPNAAAVVCVGQCSSFGNWPAARNRKWEAHEAKQPVAEPNKYRSSGAMSVPDFLDSISCTTPVVRVSGCPLRAEEIYLTVAAALINLGLVSGTNVDSWQRPKSILGIELYNKPIHNRCINKNDFLYGRFATEWGQNASGSANGGCLAKLSCKGPSSWRSCQRIYNGAARGTWEALNNIGGGSSSTLFPGSSCINAGANCYACGEPGYPDRFSHPLTSYTGYGSRTY